MALSTRRVQRNFTAGDFWGRSRVPGKPWVNDIRPDTAERGIPDIEVMVTGGNFTRESVIVWGGVDRDTTYVNKSRLTTIAEALGPEMSGVTVIAVTVRNGELTADEEVIFKMTPATVPEGTSEEILAWVNNDADRATMALEVEEAYEEPRAGLIEQLEAIINAESTAG